jgi:hypothetical protein
MYIYCSFNSCFKGSQSGDKKRHIDPQLHEKSVPFKAVMQR